MKILGLILNRVDLHQVEEAKYPKIEGHGSKNRADREETDGA